MGQNGPKGKIFVADPSNDDLWIVFRLTGHGAEDLHVEIDADSCKAVHLSEEKARDMIDTAKAAIIKPARS